MEKNRIFTDAVWDLRNRRFDVDEPMEDADGSRRWPVGDDSGKLILTGPQLVQLAVSSTPHEKFQQMLRENGRATLAVGR